MEERLILCQRARSFARTPIAGAAALSLFSPPLLAQTVPAGDTSALDRVVVTGIRQSLETSQAIKRERHGLVDGIVAEDIGKFPDTNLAEAMQRIAGVSIDRAQSGEGSKVTVRGVGPDFNLVLLNGRQMPTGLINEYSRANGSRAFDFSNLSADTVSAIEVYKSSRASVPTGGIGATIDIRTARPLDLKRRVAGLSLKANHDESGKRLPDVLQSASVTPDVSGIYSEVFADGRFGIAISGNYSKRNAGSNKAYTQAGWFTFPADSGDWGSIPPRPATGADPVTNRPTGLYSTSLDMRYSLTGIQRERVNGQLTLQWAPAKNLKLTLDHTVANNTLSKKNAELASWFGFSFGGPMTFTSGPVATPIVETNLWPNFDKDLSINRGDYGEKSRLGSTGFNADWKLSEALSLNLDAHHSSSDTKPNGPYGTYSSMALAMYTQGNAIAYYDQKLPLLGLPGTVYNAAQQVVTGSNFINNLSDQTVDQVRLGGAYKLSEDDRLGAGLGFTKTRNRAASYSNTNQDWSGVGNRGEYGNVMVTRDAISRFFTRIPGHDDPRLYADFYSYDFNALRTRAIEVAMASGTPTHPAPLTRAEAEAYFAASTDYTKGNDWRTTEKTSSAYIQWDRAFDTAIPQHLSLGLRYERTQVDSASQIVTQTGTSWESQNEISLVAGPVAFGSAQGSYAYWLPSIDWDADITDKLKLRASFGKNIGRAGWDSLLGGISINPLAFAGGGQGSAGNPALKPLVSKNFDFSAEYYYAKNSYVAASAFYKKVSNFIGTSTVNTTLAGLTTPIGGARYNAALAACGTGATMLCIRNYIFSNYAGQPGVTVTGVSSSGEIQGRITGQPGDPVLNFAITTPANEKGDNIKGVEITAQHVFGRSGFGIAGNYTWVKTGLSYDNTNLNTQAALPGVSNSANLVLFFENNEWSVRGAYNWRDAFLSAKTWDGGNNPVYTEAYGQLDLSVGYKIGDRLTLQADVINLTDSYIRQYGRAQEQLLAAILTGRRYLIGLRYKF